MKLNNPATAEAYQVVMFSGRLHLIVVVVFIKVNLFYQTELFELLQGPINRGQTEARLLLPGAAVKLKSIQVPSSLANNLQEQRPLIGSSQPS